jgi:hypothetical protein
MKIKTKIIPMIVLFGLSGCKGVNQMYNFTDVTRYARKGITYVNCVLSRNSSAFWETSKEGLILENLDVDYEKIDKIVWNSENDFDLGFYIYKEEYRVSIFYLIDSYIYTELDGSSYRASNKLKESVANEIKDSIIR